MLGLSIILLLIFSPSIASDTEEAHTPQLRRRFPTRNYTLRPADDAGIQHQNHNHLAALEQNAPKHRKLTHHPSFPTLAAIGTPTTPLVAKRAWEKKNMSRPLKHAITLPNLFQSARTVTSTGIKEEARERYQEARHTRLLKRATSLQTCASPNKTEMHKMTPALYLTSPRPLIPSPPPEASADAASVLDCFTGKMLERIQDITGTNFYALKCHLAIKEKMQGRTFSPEEARKHAITGMLESHKKTIDQHTFSPAEAVQWYWSYLHIMDIGDIVLTSTEALEVILKEEWKTNNKLANLYIALLYSDFLTARRSTQRGILEIQPHYKKIFQDSCRFRLFLKAVYTRYTGDRSRVHRFEEYLIKDAVDVLSCINHRARDANFDVFISFTNQISLGSLLFLQGILKGKFVIPIDVLTKSNTLDTIKGVGRGKAGLMRHYLYCDFKMATVASLWNRTFIAYYPDDNSQAPAFHTLIEQCLQIACLDGTTQHLEQFAQEVLLTRIIFRDILPIPFSQDIDQCLQRYTPLQNPRIIPILKDVFVKSWPIRAEVDTLLPKKIRSFFSKTPLYSFRPALSHSLHLCESWGIQSHQNPQEDLVNCLLKAKKDFDLIAPSDTTCLHFPCSLTLCSTKFPYIAFFLYHDRLFIIFPKKQCLIKRNVALQESFTMLHHLLNPNNNLAEHILSSSSEKATNASIIINLHQNNVHKVGKLLGLRIAPRE